jgi:flagellar secretion chaperone FliS
MTKMDSASPWHSYRRVATQTASPGQLVLMLYDGALRFLAQALSGFEQEDPVEFNATISNNILRTQAIIHELSGSLNMDDGGELAATLRRLYDYIDWHLVQSNIKKEPQGIKEAIIRITALRDAWAGMLNGQKLDGLPNPSTLEVPRTAS